MREFYIRGVRVDLAKSGYSILMHPNYCLSFVGDNHHVVYADPHKLTPYMNEIEANDDWYHPGGLKRKNARHGLLEAKTEVTSRISIIRPGSNPLPMAEGGFITKIETFRSRFLRRQLEREVPAIGFTNGITRTLELIAQGAEFVPLEVQNSAVELTQQMVGGDVLPAN